MNFIFEFDKKFVFIGNIDVDIIIFNFFVLI